MSARAEPADWHQPRWLIARTKRMASERMDAWLARIRDMGFEAYYPQVRSMMRVPMRQLTRHQRASHDGTLMRPRVAPFLPDRIFVRENGPIWSLCNQPNFLGFLSPSGEPARILNRFIAGLKRREIDGVIPGGTPAEYIFTAGETVQLLHSVLGTIPAKVLSPPGCAIEEIDIDTKLRLTIEMFGRPTVVDATVADVRKV